MGGATTRVVRGGVEEVGGATRGGDIINTGDEGGRGSSLSWTGRRRGSGCSLLRSGEETDERTGVSLLVGVVRGEWFNGPGRVRLMVPGILATGLEAREEGKF